MKRVSRKTLEIQRDALLKRLSKVGPFIQGSLCHKKVKCGNARCKCANGEPHEAHVLTNKVRGKTKNNACAARPL